MSVELRLTSASSSARTTACATGSASASPGALMALFTIILLAQLIFTRGPDRLRPVGRHLRRAVDEGPDLLRHRVPALSRVGRHARHLDGPSSPSRSASCSRSSPSSGWSVVRVVAIQVLWKIRRPHPHRGLHKRTNHQAQVRRRDRRCRRFRHARLAAAGARASNVAVLSEVFPTRSAHGRRPRRRGRLSRQHERGQLALPLLRHDQGFRLARRPGRDRVRVPRSTEGRVRARALRHALRPQPRRHDLPAPVRRPTANYGEKPVQRACAAADRNGHAMLHTLYQKNVEARTQFFVEWMALDLIRATTKATWSA